MVQVKNNAEKETIEKYNQLITNADQLRDKNGLKPKDLRQCI